MIFHTKNRAPEKNGEAVEIKFPAVEMLGEKIYVPVCFVAEQFGGTLFAIVICNSYERKKCKTDIILRGSIFLERTFIKTHKI